jgi:uncharacterized glyoxalase superfamily protein PhnB
MSATQAIPEGFATLTPSLVLQDAAEAISLYEKAFGAKELHRMTNPETGKIIHACLEIGTSKIFMCDANPEGGMAASGSSFYVYIKDVDAAFAKAKQAGMQEASPVQDMFWGDRCGSVTDKFGIRWTIATHMHDVSEQDMKEGMKQFMAQMNSKAKAA